MKRSAGVILFAFLVAGLAQVEAQEKTSKPVPYPAGYRDWTHTKSMVIEEGHPLYEAFGGMHHLYANEKALKALKDGKKYPDGAVFVFDLLEAKREGNAVTEGNRKVLGVMHKDAKAYAATGGWGFAGFKGDTRENVVKDMKKECFDCHAPHKDTDYVMSEYRK